MHDLPSVLAETTEDNLHPQHKWHGNACRALAQRSADGRTERWVVQEPPAATATGALIQQGAGVNGAQFKAPEIQVGRCFPSVSGSQGKELASSGELNAVL